MFQKHGALNVLLGWILANALGVAGIGVMLLLLPLLRWIPGRLLSSLAIGLPIGLAQWIALRRLTPISILWIWSIFAGLLLGLPLGSKVAGVIGLVDDESILTLAVIYAIMGFLVGLVQWFFLRGHSARASFWPLCSAAGLGLGLGMALALDIVDEYGWLAIILVLLVYTVITGWVVTGSPNIHSETASHLANDGREQTKQFNTAGGGSESNRGDLLNQATK